MIQGDGAQSEKEDARLVERARAGEPAAFEEMFLRYRGQIFSLAYRMTGNATDAEDICQDVFLQSMRKIETFRGQSSFSTWLYRVAINRSKDHLRRKKRDPSMLKETVEASTGEAERLTESRGMEPEAAAVSSEAKRLVEEALLQLPLGLRTPLVLHELEGLKYEEVGRILRLPVGTVKSRIFRARTRLAEILEPHKEQWR